MRRSFLQTATVLGLLSAIGPFAIDMYLPALPSIGKSLGASVSDVPASADAARLTAMLMLVFSVSPILAPLAGSFLIDWLDWRAVFWAVTVIAVGLLVLLQTSLDETRSATQRIESSLRGVLQAYGVLLRDRHFLGQVFIGAFGSAAFLAYLANSPFVMINHHGLTLQQYSLAFAINAASFIGASQCTAALTRRFGLLRVVRTGVTGFAATMALLAGLELIGVDRLDVLILMMLAGFGFLGLVTPDAAVLALDTHGPIAGTASALMGTLQFATSTVVMTIIAQFADTGARAMVLGIAGSALCAFALTWITLASRLDPVNSSS